MLDAGGPPASAREAGAGQRDARPARRVARTSLINAAHQSSSSTSRSGAPPIRPPSTGRGTVTSLVAGLYSAFGCSRRSRSCPESGRSTGAIRMLFPATATSVTPTPGTAAGTRPPPAGSPPARGAAVPVGQLLPDRRATSAAERPRRSGGRRPAAAARPGCSRAGCSRRPAVRPGPRPAPPRLARRPARPRPPLNAVTASPTSRMYRSNPTPAMCPLCSAPRIDPRRGSPGPSSPPPCPAPRSEFCAMVASRSCAVSVSGFSPGYRK